MTALELAEFGEPSPPANAWFAGNNELHLNNSLHWAPAAMKNTPPSLADANVIHWLRDAQNLVHPVKGSQKAPQTNRVWFRYPGQTNLVTTEDITKSTYDRVARLRAPLVSGADNGWDETQYQIEEWGRSSDIIESSGRILHFARVNNRLTQVTRTVGTLTEEVAKYEDFNPRGLPQKMTIAGKEWNIAYNSVGQRSLVTAPNGSKTKFEYYTSGGAGHSFKLKSVTRAFETPLAATQTYQYDNQGRVWKIIDEENETTLLNYDEIGGDPLKTLDRLTKVTQPNGHKQWVEWDKLDVGWSMENDGRTTTYLHDPERRVHAVGYPDGNWIEMVPGDCCGAIDTLVDQRGTLTRWLHDGAGRVTEKRLGKPNPNGGAVPYDWQTVAKYEYEYGSGRLSSVEQPTPNIPMANWNSATQWIKKKYHYVDGATDSVTVSYEDAAGVTLESTDANGVVKNGAMTKVYDAHGRLASVSDWTGTATYGYLPIAPGVDGGGRLAQMTKAGELTVSYGYDWAGRVLNRTVVEGGAETYSYDALGRLTTLASPLGTKAYTYEGKTDRVKTTNDGNIESVYQYLGMNEEHRLGGIRHGYKGGGANVLLSEFGYGYDAEGRLKEWRRNFTGSGQNEVMMKRWRMGYTYGEELESVLELSPVVNGVTFSGEYAVVGARGYGYDEAGNRVWAQENGGNYSWSANAVNQLTARSGGSQVELGGTVWPGATVTVGGATAEVTPGVNGSASLWRVRAPLPAGTNSLPLVATETNPVPGTVAQVTTKTVQLPATTTNEAQAYTYDAAGNLLNNGVQSYEWDAQNRLIKVVYRHPTTQAVLGQSEFGYDGQSRRVRVVEHVYGATAQTTLKQLVWDGLNIVQERDATGWVKKRFWDDGEERILSAEGQPLIQEKYRYTFDHLGSVREVVRVAHIGNAASNGLVARFDYAPYGTRTAIYNPEGETWDFGYTGHYTHARSGLVLAPYRAYDTELGRWLSRDPIEEEGGLNLYGYVGGDPMQYVDPLGFNPDMPSYMEGIKDPTEAANKAKECAKTPQAAKDALRQWEKTNMTRASSVSKNNAKKPSAKMLEKLAASAAALAAKAASRCMLLFSIDMSGADGQKRDPNDHGEG